MQTRNDIQSKYQRLPLMIKLCEMFSDTKRFVCVKIRNTYLYKTDLIPSGQASGVKRDRPRRAASLYNCRWGNVRASGDARLESGPSLYHHSSQTACWMNKIRAQ